MSLDGTTDTPKPVAYLETTVLPATPYGDMRLKVDGRSVANYTRYVLSGQSPFACVKRDVDTPNLDRDRARLEVTFILPQSAMREFLGSVQKTDLLLGALGDHLIAVDAKMIPQFTPTRLRYSLASRVFGKRTTSHEFDRLIRGANLDVFPREPSGDPVEISSIIDYRNMTTGASTNIAIYSPGADMAVQAARYRAQAKRMRT